MAKAALAVDNALKSTNELADQFQHMAKYQSQINAMFRYFDTDADGRMDWDQAVRFGRLLGVEIQSDSGVPPTYVSMPQVTAMVLAAINKRPTTTASAINAFLKTMGNDAGVITKEKFKWYFNLVGLEVSNPLLKDMLWLMNKSDAKAGVPVDDCRKFLIRIYVPATDDAKT